MPVHACGIPWRCRHNAIYNSKFGYAYDEYERAHRALHTILNHTPLRRPRIRPTLRDDLTWRLICQMKLGTTIPSSCHLRQPRRNHGSRHIPNCRTRHTTETQSIPKGTQLPKNHLSVHPVRSRTRIWEVNGVRIIR